MDTLTELSDEEVIAYFKFENMVKKEPDFCPLYKDNKKCHDMKELNCYLCACPNFRFDDEGFKKVEEKESWHDYICEETQEAFEARIKDFLEDLPTNQEILICSHGGTLQKMMAILGYAKNKIAYLEHIRIDNVI